VSVKERLKRQERRITGGVVLADDGEPVIFVDGWQGYQYNGLFYPDLKALDPGTYQVVEGPPIPFEMIWDEEKTWPEALEAMQARGEIYRPLEARP
jgi:hypothetical protein